MTRVPLATSPLSPSDLPTNLITASPQSTGTPRLTTGPVPPSSPTSDDIWKSTSWRDIRVSPSPLDRKQILTAGGGWEGAWIQEPLLWQDGTNWNLLYSSNPTGGLGWATCPLASDPLVPSNWTKFGSNPIIAPGAGPGVGAYGSHFGVYTEGATTYIYSPAVSGGNVYVASCPSTPFTPGSLAWQTAAAYTRVGQSTLLNPINLRVFKRGAGDYVMFFTYNDGGGGGVNWRAGVATATNPLGPFTLALAPITTLDPVAPAAGGGGTDGPIIQQQADGTYVGLYHATAQVNLTGPTDIFRAVTANLTTDSWTKLDNSFPFVRRAALYEVDQVADVCVATAPNGRQFMAWDSLDNVAGTSSITAAPMTPTEKTWDGSGWRVGVPQSPVLPLSGIAGNESYGQGALKNVAPAYPAVGGGNTAFGTRALSVLTTGIQNTAMGTNALQVSTASFGTAVGYKALVANTTGTNNTALGSTALVANTTGANNTALGQAALTSNIVGNSNAAVGQGALTNCTGSNNTALGQGAGGGLTTGGSNTAVGTATLTAVNANSNSTAVGKSALTAATGQNNTAVGQGALGGTGNTGSSNTALGQGSLIAAGNTASSNVAVGAGALAAVTTGGKNTAVGTVANGAITAAANTTAIGYGTLASASGAVAIGIDHNSVSASAPTQDYFVLGTVSHKLFIPGLPTADPVVAGQLYTAGAPSAGTPKAVMVSGG